MIAETPLRTTQLSAFNPGRLTDEEMERIFITRIKVFEHIFKQITAEKNNSIPQHLLIIGERGMGKSTLLHRLAVELRKSPHNATFIPLTFPEEQYNVDRLSKFWLNCLDALADALDRIGHPELAALDADIDRWNKEARQINAMQMYGHFNDWRKRLQRRPVLLVDNLNLIFEKISKEEQHQLRAILMENDAPLLVGASAHSIEDVVNYGAPFYDYFRQFTLKKLSFDEALETLRNLGELTNNKAFINEVYAKQPRIRALYQLTGGTPRTLTMLYPLIQNGFSVSIQTDLEALMDTATALYKARFEELPAQMQVVLDAVALHWDPVTIETLRELTQLDNAQISPQLKRLYDTGWLTRMNAYRAKGSAYEISERFFNIWYLMRRSSRRQKRELLCLTKFLATFYGEELPTVAKEMLGKGVQHPDHAGIHLAMADAVRDKRLAKKLRDGSYNALVEWGIKDDSIFRDFEIPKKFINKKEGEYYQEALKAFEGGQYALAAEKFEAVVRLNKDRAEGWFALGNLYMQHLNCYKESERAYLKGIELDEKNAKIWNNLGLLYMQYLNRNEESEQAYLKGIELNEKNAGLWHNLGNLYVEYLNRYEESERAYLKAIELDEKNAGTWHNLGYLYGRYLNRYAESERAYLKAIELDEKDAGTWHNLGNLYVEHLNRYMDSERAYLKGIELDEENTGLWYNLGNLYGQYLNRYTDSERAYFKAIELNEKDALPWHNLGNLYMQHLNRYADSERAYLKAIELDGKYASPWNSLGNLYQDHLNRYADAEHAYQKVLSIDPAYNYAKPCNYAKHNLIFLYRDKMNRLAEAKAVYETLQPEDGATDTYYLHATLFDFYDKNAGIASENLQKALAQTDGKLPPDTQDDWWRFAAVAHRLGYGGEGLQTLETSGYDVQLRPYYEAIKALGEKDSAAYLNSLAAEVREPAGVILERIRRY